MYHSKLSNDLNEALHWDLNLYLNYLGNFKILPVFFVSGDGCFRLFWFSNDVGLIDEKMNSAGRCSWVAWAFWIGEMICDRLAMWTVCWCHDPDNWKRVCVWFVRMNHKNWTPVLGKDRGWEIVQIQLNRCFKELMLLSPAKNWFLCKKTYLGFVCFFLTLKLLDWTWTVSYMPQNERKYHCHAHIHEILQRVDP